MNGRIFGIKKTLIQRITNICLCLCFAILLMLSLFVIKKYDLWFFSFCLCVGISQIVKSFFFSIDSSLYLGSLLIFIGVSGFCFNLLNTNVSPVFYICGSFVLASVATFIICKQKFHLIIAYSITFVTIFASLLVENLITTPIFIAFVVPFLVLLGVATFVTLKWRR